MTGLRKHVDVIHNGLDLEEIRGLAAGRADHSWLDDVASGLVLGVGRLSAQKNFSMLIRAFARLSRPHSRLLILGEGPEREPLQRLAAELGVAERVQLAGFVTNPFPYFARCSAFVLSSRWEGFANVVIEAMACGAPVVATDCPGGPADLLQGSGFGRLVPVDDIAAMAEAIGRTLDEPADRETIRARAEAHSIRRTARRYLELFARWPDS
jgi:glycosyltransferase involved in cell wall biosynthesis